MNVSLSMTTYQGEGNVSEVREESISPLKKIIKLQNIAIRSHFEDNSIQSK